MTLLLSVVACAAIAASLVLAKLYLRASHDLARFASIKDAEAHKADCERQAGAALSEEERLRREAEAMAKRLTAQKSAVRKYQAVLGDLKSAAELQFRIRTDTEKVQQLAATIKKLGRVAQLDENMSRQEAEIGKRKTILDQFENAIGQARDAAQIAAQVKYHENLLAQLKADIEAVEEAGELQEFGFYRARFAFGTAEEYRKRLEFVRSQQKSMLKAKNACECHTEWTVDGNKREGQKMVTQQIKLMLRAFNGECDAAVSKASYNNVVSLESRIKRSFEAINKLGVTKKVYLAESYCQLKFDELHLAHEWEEKKQEEREEQRRVREQMKEEQKVAKEIEETCRKAEIEESMKAAALETARRELAAKEGQQTEKLAALVAKLENELQEAIDRKAKAIARAQLTRSGHVYVLSNVGTFGEGVYKIGLTRRLEPLERVEELSGAAVPFPFDVHALIYSEDAPKLENALHRHFTSRRVNLVNLRREFFRVSLGLKPA